jgi:Arc/MetJ family transcription regulator
MAAGKSVNSAPGKSRKRSNLVRTNIVIDRELVEEVKRRTGAKSAREAVQRALERAAAKPDYSGLLALRDLDPIRPFYDPKDPMAEERAEQAMVREGKANYAVVPPARKRTAKKPR